MHPTLRALAPGLARRSFDEAKRFVQIALSNDAITNTFAPRTLMDFSDPEMIPQCKTMSDAGIGGFSAASLDYVPETKLEPAHARFHGSISTELPRNNAQVQKTGFAGWRNKDRPPTIFGRSLWDLDSYYYLSLRVKSDGRKYFVNVQTDSVVPTDLHQHRLHTRKIGEWETVIIHFGSFVRTNHGEVVEPQNEMLRERTSSVGLSLTDRLPGPFDIAISKIWVSQEKDHDQV